MGNLVSNFFDEEDNIQEIVEEQIQPPFLEQLPIKKKRKNKTARRRRTGEKHNTTMNNHSNYNY
jgi:hypothetical protein